MAPRREKHGPVSQVSPCLSPEPLAGHRCTCSGLSAHPLPSVWRLGRHECLSVVLAGARVGDMLSDSGKSSLKEQLSNSGTSSVHAGE